MRVAILGSCITRDAFSFFPSPSFEVVAYQARSSFISMVSPRITLDHSKVRAPTPFEKNCIVADFEKTSLDIIKCDFDYIIMDFVDERFDLIQIGSSYVLGTMPMMNS